jgi:hypothetical protein
MFVIRKSRTKKRADAYLAAGGLHIGQAVTVANGRIEVFDAPTKISVNLRPEDIAAIAKAILASDSARLKEALTGELSPLAPRGLRQTAPVISLEPQPDEPFPRFDTSGVLKLVVDNGEGEQ